MFSRSRQFGLFALSMGSILIVFAGVVYHREVEDQIQAFDKLLYRKSKVMAARADTQFYQGRWWVNLKDVPLLENTLPLDSELIYVRWYNPKGQLVHL